MHDLALPQSGDPAVLGRPQRLDVLRRTVLLDSPSEEAFDRLTRLASTILEAPVALVSLVDEDRQFFKSCVGLPDPWASTRETPLSHSFCQHAVATGEPLIIEDARETDFLADNLAIPDLQVIAYAGIPLIISGETLGSFCVIDHQPRQWTENQLAILRDLAASAATEIELRLRTAETEANAAMAEGARQELVALLESAGEGIYGLDNEGRCTFINREALKQLGYSSADEVLGQNMHALVHHSRPDGTPYPPEECPTSIARRDRVGLRIDDETFWRKDGTSFPVSFSAYPLIVGDEVTGVVTSFQDTTDARRAAAERQRLLEAERKSREDAEKALRMRDEMLAIVSHDLRNPASTIFMSAALMLETPLDEEHQLEQVAIIKRQAQRMNALIGDLLDVTLIESGRLRVSPSDYGMSSLLSEAASMVRPAANVDVRIAPDSEAVQVWVDGDRIQQVFSNLISNAIRYTPDGGSVTLTARRDGDEVVVSVRDTGAGIGPEELPHLFDRYWQGAARNRGGAGLGLAISKGIIDAHGGRIWVESEVGVGTTFSFTLPLADGKR